MTSAQQPPSWSKPAKPSEEARDYANQERIKTKAQAAVNDTVGKFKTYEVVLFIEQVIKGSCDNYVVKVDTGNGDDKFVDVQFVMPHPDWPSGGGIGPVLFPEFEAAKQTTKSAPLHPIKDK